MAAQWVARFVVPIFAPDAAMLAMIGGLAGGLLVVVWWAFFSRAAHVERWGAVALMIAALAAAPLLLDASVATAGMGVLFYMYALPVLSLAFVLWAVVTRRLSDRVRRVTMVATILLAVGVWGLVRIGGISQGGESDFAWRWTPTAEERMLAHVPAGAVPAGTVPAGPIPANSDSSADSPQWPGFRGPGRDGNVPGTRIATDWAAAPPEELWRQPVGPGWSSFAVAGDVFYTQEQRGEEEVVSCYRLHDGEPVWRHAEDIRFWEANAGAGPRATPLLHGDRVYAIGATGILNALDARDGRLIWSRDVAADTGQEVPYWGIAGSPVVVESAADAGTKGGGVVIVAAGGQLAGYDLANGERRWLGPDGGESYSSPQLETLEGTEQVVLMSKSGAVSLAPADGVLLWSYDWPTGPRIVQPARTADGDLLLSQGGTTGLRRLGVRRTADGWVLAERWTSTALKPYFSDFVVHEGHAYGFDGTILASIDLADGERDWKGGRYGSGQLLLLPDQDLLLVLSEKGELALVRATPERFEELARLPALEGKTWNHPVVVGDILLLRNDREMAAFRLLAQP